MGPNRETGQMQTTKNTTTGGRTVSLRRLLAGIGATFVLSFALTAGTASATTVYDYVYSGTFFDGSGAGKTFTDKIGGLDYDRTNHVFYVAEDGQPGGFITKITPAGAGVNFTATGTPRVLIGKGPFENQYFGDPQVSLDQTGGPNNGNFYADGSARKYGWKASGEPIPEFEGELSENGQGIAVMLDGNIMANGNSTFPGRGRMTYFNAKGKSVSSDFPGYIGLKPSIKRKWGEFGSLKNFEIDNDGNIWGPRYVGGNEGEGILMKMDPAGVYEKFEANAHTNFGQRTRGVAIDRSDNNIFAIRENNTFEMYDDEGRLLGSGWGVPDAGKSYLGLLNSPIGIEVDPVTHDVWVANRRIYPGSVTRVEKFERVNPHKIPGVTSIKAGYDDPKYETITLRGLVNPDAVPTIDCHFEWGPTQALGTSVPCDQGNIHLGSSDIEVTADVSVTKGQRYWYRLSSKNANNQVALSDPEHFIPQYDPIVNSVLVDRINTDGVRFSAEIDPNGGNGSVHFEWGTNGNFEFSTAESDTVGFNTENEVYSGTDYFQPGIYTLEQEPTGLTPGTKYEFRAVVSNEATSVVTPVQEFTTYVPDPGIDNCDNAQVRQQTESSLLPDCRAYELASTRNSGGYDVVSDIVPGQSPIDAYPRAQDSLLYSIHIGLIPGIEGNPTNLGLDPYVATRGNSGWTTRYVGLPSQGMEEDGAFGSPLLGADSLLRTFAFGGPDICNPCFADGSTNVPVRKSDGSLVKGMAGSTNPAANPVGEVRRPVSADGSHFIFGANKKFETVGNEPGISIYDRNLDTSTTQVVSTMPNGTTMTGEVAELDVSADGNRVLIGKEVGEDSEGNGLYDLYMHVGTSANSVEVIDTGAGVIFNGMTSDGTVVYFSTAQPLPGDTDVSVDLYGAQVGATATVSRISTGSGATGNTDLCSPAGTPDSWNAASGEGKCSIVAFAGGSGVAAADGTVYFASPEKLDGGQGIQDQVNLYVAGIGSAPEFVGTIDTSVGKAPPPPPLHPVENATFGGAMSTPKSVAVDQSNGDVYIATTGDKKVQRFDEDGVPKIFTAGPGIGTNAIPGLEWPFLGAAQVAIDNSPGPANGDIYVVSQNMSFESQLNVFSSTGAPLATLKGTGTPGGAFGFACGVAVDQSNGNVYVGDYFGQIWRYTPGANPVTEANYSGGINAEFGSCQLATAGGKVYAAGQESEVVKRYNASDFALGAPPSPVAKVITTGGRSVSTDTTTGNVYVALTNKVSVYDDDAAATLVETFGTPTLTNSQALAVRSSNLHTFATNNNNAVVEFGSQEQPYKPIDHRAIVHGVQQAEVHNYGDIQVTPDGRYALFTSKLQLTGFDNRGLEEIYRYDTTSSAVDCVSCATTGAAPATGTTMSEHGLALTDDGRAFFTSLESFTLRDTNEKLDVYEWNDGELGLISTGIGNNDSGLVTVSADGVDAFFYSREKLSPQDENGNAIKIYDAREEGGFLFDPDSPPCAASDECHGAGSQAPPPPNINTQTGSGQDTPKQKSAPKKCPKGKVKKKGKCVKKRKKSKSQSTQKRG
jgi:hypothetical protein